MSQLPILEPKVSCSEIRPNKVTQFSSFFFILPSLPLNGPSFQSFTGFCDTRISSSSFIMASFLANILVPCRGVSSSSSQLYQFTWEVRTTSNIVKGPASGISKDIDFSKQSPVVRRLISANPRLNFKLGLFFF